MKNAPRIMVIAGEASGDAHAARVVETIRRDLPAATFFGVGGPALEAAGVELAFPASELSLVGIVEVLSHYRHIKRRLLEMRQRLVDEQPDLLIVTDLPEFNMRLAKTAQEQGIPVLYYISPQIWAWRKGRLKTIARRVDAMAVVFPFEVPIYEAAGVPVRFVGHPLATDTPVGMSRAHARRVLGLPLEPRIVGLFPGSRVNELQRLMPALADGASRLLAEAPTLRFVVPLADGLDPALVEEPLAAAGIEATIVRGQFHATTAACDAIASASGTATLQIGLMGTPLTVIYRVSALTGWIARLLVNLEHVSLVNIVAEKPVVREYLQREATGENIADELRRLLFDTAYADRVRGELAELRARLGDGDAPEAVAEWAVEIIADSGRVSAGSPDDSH